MTLLFFPTSHCGISSTAGTGYLRRSGYVSTSHSREVSLEQWLHMNLCNMHTSCGLGNSGLADTQPECCAPSILGDCGSTRCGGEEAFTGCSVWPAATSFFLRGPSKSFRGPVQAMRATSIACAFLAALAPAGYGAPNLIDRSSSSTLVSVAGDRAIIPEWHIQSTQHVSDSAGTLSRAGADVSTWYHVSSRGTVMAGLLENGVYSDSDLFFSNNLDTKVDYSAFNEPWLYRGEFVLNPEPGQRYFVQTNGITSRGDVYMNGVLIASKDVQVGSYGGQKYEVTQHVLQGENCIVIAAYPTNYLRDFAMGFVDWNPYPPDNGTGVWRYVEVSQTGPVSMSPPRIVTDFKDPSARKVAVTINTDVQNNGSEVVDVQVGGTIRTEAGSQEASLSQTARLQPGEGKTVSMTVSLDDPQIWWPSSWGDQPLYKVSANASIKGTISDVAEERSFGIRHVASSVNAHNDTAFVVNGHPFLVMGAGYSPDIFMRFNLSRLRIQFQYVLDMGLNTVRLEGKQEHPEFYDLADHMGLMVLAGWECCDKWEGWSYNDEADGVKWNNADYSIANTSMIHEAAMMQNHPSMLAFLVGSDFWPDDRATKIYVDALNHMDWTNPIIASAAKLGYPALLGPSGMKMDGPYDWVPPNYWYGDDLGAAFGFGSELGSGVGTPELSSLKKFLSPDDMDDLWTQPNKGLFHMSTNVSSFFDRSIYNEALSARYGKPSSLDDYLLKAQIMDFEATRSEFEAYAARKNAAHPSTGA
jgi:exo-1,4-beta-D-glucosaminidase